MKKLIVLFFILWSSILYGQQFPVKLLAGDGKPNRIQIVIINDGYVKSKYDSIKAYKDDTTLIGVFKRKGSPLTEYFSYYNFYSITPPSVDSGIKVPSVASCYPITNPNNFCGSTMGYMGICRFTTCNMTTVNNILTASFPNYTVALLMVNANDKAGGSSEGMITMVTSDKNGFDAAIHEAAGHSQFGMGDEYVASGSCNHQPAWNGVTSNNPAQSYWYDLMPNGMPSTACDYGQVGMFLGSCYCADMYRPECNCEMKTLNQPFCKQCKKRGVYSFSYYVNPINSVTPPLTVSTTDKFTVDIQQPTTKTVKVVWYLNGVISKKNVTTFTPPNGTYKVTVEAYDTSVWLATTQAKKYTYTWNSITVNSNPPACATPLASSLVTSNISFATATLNWQPVSGATKYHILLSNGLSYVTTSQPYTLQFLIPNTNYSWKVKSFCGSDSSEYSANISFMTAQSPPPTCTFPALSVKAKDRTSITVSWEKNTYTDHYGCYKRIAGSQEWSNQAIQSGNATQNRFAKLNANSLYELKIIRYCKDGREYPTILTTNTKP